MPERVISPDHHPTLRHEDRVAIGSELQGVLVTLLDLAMLGKQAHWTLVGPNFRALHLFLDELVDRWRQAGDEVAERAVALGYLPDGRVQTVAERTILSPLSHAQLPDREVIGEFTRLLTDAIGDIRERMDRLEDVDTVTADLLHGVVRGLEENLWMVRSQSA